MQLHIVVFNIGKHENATAHSSFPTLKLKNATAHSTFLAQKVAKCNYF